MPFVICPLCGTRRARRGCPALGQQICAVCCGTKRLVEIPCPRDCAWLASAREHPPAVAVRQHQRDMGVILECVRDFDRRQSQLFLLIATFLVRHEPSGLQRVIDEDVVDACTALASTFETASRGVIYEHRPASRPAAEMVSALTPILAEAGKGGGTPFERDAVVVLRRLADAGTKMRSLEPGNGRALLDLLARVISATGDAPSAEPSVAQDEPRLIVP